jgi:uncharacterized protein YigE (DUF2233 family)
MKKESWFKTHVKTCLGVTMMLASVVVLVLSLGVFSDLFVKPVLPQDAVLSDFVIVAADDNMDKAITLASEFAKNTGIDVPVVEANAYENGHAIFVGTRDFNSYGGYRFKISTESDGQTACVYLDGSGHGLTEAVKNLVATYTENETPTFPFGLEEAQFSYAWNTTDPTMTGLGHKFIRSESRELAEGVTLMELSYEALGIGRSTAYAVIVKADAAATMMAVAAPWDSSNSVENPVKLYTVEEYGQQLTQQGYEVLAISNAGFFQKAAGSNLPWGVQIMDGVVIKAPNLSQPKYTDNWVGITKDGKYVISNTKGYKETYEGNIQWAVGGHQIMMKDSVPDFISGTPYYHTGVGLTKNGDLVIVQANKTNYAGMIRVFMDLDLDIETVLNLDGGGSTTLHAVDEYGELSQYFCGNGAEERPIMDCIAIIKKDK